MGFPYHTHRFLEWNGAIRSALPSLCPYLTRKLGALLGRCGADQLYSLGHRHIAAGITLHAQYRIDPCA
jgi:hypothetical protein